MKLLCYLISLLLCKSYGRKLIQGNLIWRHGDRSSPYTYPKDPYKYVWKDGKMQLTEKGMAQAYNLGLYLQSKYGQLISDKYKEGEIYMKSTDTERTIMTAQCVGAGLYAPSNTTTWKGSRTYWRPFPIHSESEERDWLSQRLKNPDKGCPTYKDRMKKIQRDSKFYNYVIAKYSQFLKNMTALTHIEKPYDFDNISELYDNFICLKSHGYKLPRWVDDVTLKTLEYLTALHQGLEYTDYEMKHTKSLAKMRSGIIMENMLENMKKRINKNDMQYGIVGYSAHDISVTALLVSMGANNWIVPPYASCVMIDLYLEKDMSYSVEFWYRNDSTKAPHRLSFYECGVSCTFKQFEKVASTIIPGSDNSRLCGIEYFDSYCLNYFAVGATVLVFILLLFVASRCFFFTKNPYSKVPQDETNAVLKAA